MDLYYHGIKLLIDKVEEEVIYELEVIISEVVDPHHDDELQRHKVIEPTTTLGERIFFGLSLLFQICKLYFLMFTCNWRMIHSVRLYSCSSNVKSVYVFVYIMYTSDDVIFMCFPGTSMSSLKLKQIPKSLPEGLLHYRLDVWIYTISPGQTLSLLRSFSILF